MAILCGAMSVNFFYSFSGVGLVPGCSSLGLVLAMVSRREGGVAVNAQGKRVWQ